ncbi:hypothetical protein FGO68_gene11226 [Halteria grandinella]|uniref:tRNA-guanine(15) transglycosylase-like domain-containing protein n=1 Tax=Halteria grandinella TaxID=5974 RepID=A0A8J8SW77_HALGN|nr:hypothetical protein FGO68_gene11226 [Halteria grandinella]
MIYGTDVLEYPQRYSDIKEFLAQTDKNKVRATLGLGSPVEILNGVLAGIDIFESDYPLTQASLGHALQIQKIEEGKSECTVSDIQLSKLLETKQQHCIDLNKEEFKESKEPLVTGCQCYTCKNYNRAYLYHMLEVKEMNANILIAIHNVAQFDLLFGQIRDNVKSIGAFIQDYAQLNCIDK